MHHSLQGYIYIFYQQERRIQVWINCLCCFKTIHKLNKIGIANVVLEFLQVNAQRHEAGKYIEENTGSKNMQMYYVESLLATVVCVWWVEQKILSSL